MNTFNIGDRVIVLKGARPDFVGKIGTVISVDPIDKTDWYWKSHDGFEYGLMCDDGKPRNGFGCHCLALTDIPQPQPAATAPANAPSGDVPGPFPYDTPEQLSLDLADMRHSYDTLKVENDALKKDLRAAYAEQTELAAKDSEIARLRGDSYRDLYIQASGTLAIVASWLRGADGDMSDLTAQDIYDMIAKEQGLPAAVITKDSEISRLRGELEAANRRDGMLSRDLVMARSALMPFYNMWVRWFDDNDSLAGISFGSWFWREAESSDIERDYKGAVDAINKAEML